MQETQHGVMSEVNRMELFDSLTIQSSTVVGPTPDNGDGFGKQSNKFLHWITPLDYYIGLPHWITALEYRFGLPQWITAFDYRIGLSLVRII